VSHSTLQRLVHRQEFEEPTALQGVSEVSIDGGKVRLFSNQGCGKLLTTKPFAYRVFIMVHFFQSNLSLSDWVNSQRLCPLVCLGDGHDGVWNLFEEIGSTAIRQEILVSSQRESVQSWWVTQTS